MAAVTSLTRRAIVLHKGNVVFEGKTEAAVKVSQSNFKSNSNRRKHVNASVILESIQVYGISRDHPPSTGQRCHFEFQLLCSQTSSGVRLAVGVNDEFGKRIFTLDTVKYDVCYSFIPGVFRVVCIIEQLNLVDGEYFIDVYVGNKYEAYDYISGDWSFHVEQGMFFPVAITDSTHGPVLVSHQWAAARQSATYE
jgi:hypothetical protein